MCDRRVTILIRSTLLLDVQYIAYLYIIVYVLVILMSMSNQLKPWIYTEYIRTIRCNHYLKASLVVILLLILIDTDSIYA